MNPQHHGCLVISCLEEVIWHFSSIPFTYSSPTVFISYSWLTEYHRFSNLRQHIFIISQFPWVRNLDIGLNWVLFLGSHKTEVRVSAGLHSPLELDWGRVHFQAHSGCWQNSFSCGRMTKCTTFYWLQAKDWPQVLSFLTSSRGQPSFLATWTSSIWPSSLSSQQRVFHDPVCWNGV